MYTVVITCIDNQHAQPTQCHPNRTVEHTLTCFRHRYKSATNVE